MGEEWPQEDYVSGPSSVGLRLLAEIERICRDWLEEGSDMDRWADDGGRP